MITYADQIMPLVSAALQKSTLPDYDVHHHATAFHESDFL
jgi:hypothetical protein